MSSTRTLLKGILTVVAITVSNVSNGGIITFTDRTLFEEALTGSTFVTEIFDGSNVSFDANSTGNPIGAFTTVDLIGGVESAGNKGLREGFFEGKVDSAGTDVLKLNFNIGPALGFGIIGLQNDSLSKPDTLHLQEIGFVVNGRRYLASDILGLTKSLNGLEVGDVDSKGPIPFIGFISTKAFSSFQMVHGSEIAPGGVSGGTNEEFFIKSLVVAPAKVPAPASIALFAIALLGLSASKVRKIAE